MINHALLRRVAAIGAIIATAGGCGARRDAPTGDAQLSDMRRAAGAGQRPRAADSSRTTRSGKATDRLASISPGVFLGHVAFLAHDELEGRDTGSDGIDLAAGYIAGQFVAAGLRPGGPNGTYFQEFTAPGQSEILPETSLAVSGAEISPVLKTDFVPFGFSKQGSFEGDLVFAGYGIAAVDQNFDDYKDLDVEGKVVLMLRRQPAWLGEAGDSPHASFRTKVKVAAEHGAAAVLIVNQKPEEGSSDSLARFRALESDAQLPALHVTRDLADRLLAVGGLPNLEELQRKLDEERAFVSAPTNLRVSGNVAIKTEQLQARNVIGVLPGMGSHADEYVVIGGHYDHLGVRRDQIHNGADDNASGTAGVIEACKALAETTYRDRSVLCMAFSGEERGLLGSEHFCESPTVPIRSIKAMINMDMIGRLTHDSEDNMLAIQGLGTGLAFQEIVDRRTRQARIKYLPDPSAKGPSDHAPFYEAGVPALFFFTGVHEDYHQPGDDTDKVNAEGGAQIAELVYAIAHDLINAEEPPVYAQVDQPARIMRGAANRGGGVVLGIMPDFEDESGAKGWRIAQVFPGGGAAKAGMRAGDRVLLIEGSEVNSMADYRKVTEGKKAGDKVAITILRGAEQLVLDVELQSREGAGRRGGPPAEANR